MGGHLPEYIDVIKIFKMKCLPRYWVKKACDLGFFLIHSSRTKGLIGTNMVWVCTGNLYCSYDNCPFKLSTSEKRNTSTSRMWKSIRYTSFVDMLPIGSGVGHEKWQMLQGVWDSYHLPHRCKQVCTETKHQEIQALGQRSSS